MGTFRDEEMRLVTPRGMSSSLLSFLPTSPLPLATFSSASCHRVPESGEKRRLFWEHILVSCWLCWRTWSQQSVLTHIHELHSWSHLLSVSTQKCIPGPSSQVTEFCFRALVCIKCLQDYCTVSLQLFRLVYIIQGYN